MWRRSSGANATGAGSFASYSVRQVKRDRCGRRRGEPVELRIDEGRGELARAVGAEIHEDHRVAVVHRGCAGEHGRRHEFVVSPRS